MRFSLKRKCDISLRTLIIFLLLSTVFFILYFIESHLKATLFEIAEIKAKNLATHAINNVIREKIIGQYNQQELLQVKLDAQGKVSFVQPNTIEFNKLSSDIVIEVQQILKNLAVENVDIPMGQLTGTPLLAGFGPPITVKIIPMGTVNVELMNNFTDAGINQTKHSIGISVTTDIKIVVPLMSKAVEVHTIVPITEYVIVGGVPDTYVKFPGQ